MIENCVLYRSLFRNKNLLLLAPNSQYLFLQITILSFLSLPAKQTSHQDNEQLKCYQQNSQTFKLFTGLVLIQLLRICSVEIFPSNIQTNCVNHNTKHYLSRIECIQLKPNNPFKQIHCFVDIEDVLHTQKTIETCF